MQAVLNGEEYQGSAARSRMSQAYLQRYASEIITLRLQVSQNG
jgi:hypothetical protein